MLLVGSASVSSTVARLEVAYESRPTVILIASTSTASLLRPAAEEYLEGIDVRWIDGSDATMASAERALAGHSHAVLALVRRSDEFDPAKISLGPTGAEVRARLERAGLDVCRFVEYDLSRESGRTIFQRLKVDVCALSMLGEPYEELSIEESSDIDLFPTPTHPPTFGSGLRLVESLPDMSHVDPMVEVRAPQPSRIAPIDPEPGTGPTYKFARRLVPGLLGALGMALSAGWALRGYDSRPSGQRSLAAAPAGALDLPLVLSDPSFDSPDDNVPGVGIDDSPLRGAGDRSNPQTVGTLVVSGPFDGQRDWDAAIRYCGDLDLHGEHWRVPDRRELEMLHGSVPMARMLWSSTDGDLNRDRAFAFDPVTSSFVDMDKREALEATLCVKPLDE